MASIFDIDLPVYIWLGRHGETEVSREIYDIIDGLDGAIVESAVKDATTQYDDESAELDYDMLAGEIDRLIAQGNET